MKKGGEVWRKGKNTYVETIYGSFVDTFEYEEIVVYDPTDGSVGRTYTR